jgi:thiol-disulfide isomerase/thioredoxin
MVYFSFKRLVGATLMAVTAGLFSSAAQADHFSKYLTGELSTLTVIHRDVNFSDIRLTSAFGDDGKEITPLAMKKGKILLVTFWAKNCPKCRSHLKQLAAAQKAAGKDKLEVIAVNSDLHNFAWIRKALDARGLAALGTYQDYNRNLFDRMTADPMLRFYGSQPKTLILGPEGKVRAIANSRVDWEAPEVVDFLDALQKGGI